MNFLRELTALCDNRPPGAIEVTVPVHQLMWLTRWAARIERNIKSIFELADQGYGFIRPADRHNLEMRLDELNGKKPGTKT